MSLPLSFVLYETSFQPYVYDDRSELDEIKQLLHRYRAGREGIKIDEYTNGDALIESMRLKDYHILLIDILMPGINGIETAREIRSFNPNINIVFVTNSPEFAVDGYSVRAFDYILKPVTEKKLFGVMDELMKRIVRNEEMLILTSHFETLRLPFSNIEFVEIFNKKILIHLDDGTVKEKSGTLSDCEKKLSAHREFIKVHRSYVVNMDCILSLTKDGIITYTDKKVPVSRLLYNEVKQKYIEYLFEEGGETL